MTREHKLALIVGFSLFLVLGVLISDHFSKARQVELADNIQPASAKQMGAAPPGVHLPVEPGVTGAVGSGAPILSQPVTTVATGRSDLVPMPGSGATQLVAVQPRVPTTALANVNTVQFPPLGAEHYDPPGTVTPPPATTPQIPVQKYEIQSGDTLYRVCVKYYNDGKLWEKLRDYNKVNANTLREGMTLNIPPKEVLLGKPYMPPAQATQTPGSGPTTITMDGRTRTGAADAAKANTPDAAKPSGDASSREYVVKEGDTLVAIARKMLNSGKRYNEIIELNKGTLSDPEALTVGMKLRIPAK